MKKEKSLDWILRKRKFDIYDFDMVLSKAYFDGMFKNDMDVEYMREVISHLVDLARKN
jgi:hypothetical protein